MPPAQFSDHMVPPIKQVTNLHRVVTTWNTAGTDAQCRNQQDNKRQLDQVYGLELYMVRNRDLGLCVTWLSP